jgi:SAM-dependent methyltransferase
VSSDIFAGQPSDPAILAELYDLEHDEIIEDLAFYREMAGRAGDDVLDVGCGSGRLFGALLAGGATRIVGVDGSSAMLERAERRIAADRDLAAAEAAGRIRLVQGDARQLPVLGPQLFERVEEERRGFSLAIAVGLVPHLDGPEELLRLLHGVTTVLARHGILLLDDLGPAQLPERDLPLTLDWTRTMDGRRVVRRSQLVRHPAPEGLRVDYSTITDIGRPDGTIARLSATHRLWYPSLQALADLVAEAGLVVRQVYGSHDLDPLTEESDRRILVTERTGPRKSRYRRGWTGKQGGTGGN